MPRVSRRARALPDRPGRFRLLRRRLRRLARPALLSAAAVLLAAAAGFLLRPASQERGGGGSAAAEGGAVAAGSIASSRERLARLSDLLGWRVREVVVEGRTNTPEPLLRAALGVSAGDAVLGFSVAEAAARIETLPWIEAAAVERRLPDIVLVALTERRPYAIWQSQGKFRLIDHAGQVLADHNVGAFRFLPLVVGAGAAEHAAELLDVLARYPVLQARVVASVRVGDRRWNLCMGGGADVLLPEGHEAAAVERLASLQTAHDLLDRPLRVIDLRLPDRLVLRPQPSQALDTPGVAKGGTQGVLPPAEQRNALLGAPAPACRPTSGGAA